MPVRLVKTLLACAVSVVAVAGPAEANTFRGTAGSDDVTGMAGHDNIVTFAGDDHIRSRGGDDLVRLGRTGRHGDEYALAVPARTASTRVRRDYLDGRPGDDWLRGGPGLDLLVDAGGSDHFSGGT